MDDSQEQPQIPFHIWGDWSMSFTFPNPMAEGIMGEIKQVFLGGTFAMLIDNFDRLWSWGYSTDGCLGLGDQNVAKQPALVSALDGATIVEVAIGSQHVLAMNVHGQVYAWGNNEHGQLGINRVRYPSAPEPKKVMMLPPAAHVYCTKNSSYIVSHKGEILSWGQNDKGQLGIGNTMDYDTPQNVTQKYVGFKQDIKATSLVVNNKQVISFYYQQAEMEERVLESSDDYSEEDKDEVDTLQQYSSSPGQSKTTKTVSQSGSKSQGSRQTRQTRKTNQSRQSHHTSFSDDSGAMHGIKRRIFDNELAETIRNTLDLLNKVHGQLRNIDDILADSLVEDESLSQRINVQDLTTKINRIRETCSLEFLKLENKHTGDKNWATYRKFFNLIMIDAISLRALVITTLKMVHYERKVHHRNLYQIDNHSLNQIKAYLPSQELYHASLYCCKKVLLKLEKHESNFRTLTQGCNTLVCESIAWSPSCLRSLSILVAGLNKFFMNQAKDRERIEKKEYKQNLTNSILSVYSKLQRSSIDHIMEQHQFEVSNGKTIEEYVKKVLRSSDSRINKSLESLHNIKVKQQQYFNESLKPLFKVIVENGELRKLINALQRKVLQIDSSKEGQNQSYYFRQI